jgi:hypothetical protein
MEVSGQLHPQVKNPWYPLDRRLPGGPQSWSGRGSEEKNSQPQPELEPPIIQTIIQSYKIISTGKKSWEAAES